VGQGGGCTIPHEPNHAKASSTQLQVIRLPVLCPMGRVTGCWPANGSGRSMKKRMNNNIDEMYCRYACPCKYGVALLCVVYLYTSVKPPISKEGVECEI
jgi:hypothetical protein